MFDVHCNACFPFFIILGETFFVCLMDGKSPSNLLRYLGLLQYLLLPLLLMDGLVIAFISNFLYFSAVGTYFYVSFLGSRQKKRQMEKLIINNIFGNSGCLTLPFISKEVVSVVLTPIVFFAFLFLLFSLFGFNCTKIFIYAVT